ncbi:MAG: ATP-binding protein [Lachnospiraceae bacterium]|nr:ATP-binding protein [Lachnospiraceae bacterium]
MKTLTVLADIDKLDEACGFVEECLEATDCTERAKFQIRLAVEEIFVNIANYAYKPEDGNVTICCEYNEENRNFAIGFYDTGKPFDPLAKEDADISEEALLEREGGLGILLVKKTMDEVSYAYRDGQNILTVVKRI